MGTIKKKARPLKPSQIADVRHLIEGGLSAKEVSEKLGVSVSQAYSYTRALRLKLSGY